MSSTQPEIFLTAAAELSTAPEHYFVVEDAPSGVQAAKAGAVFTSDEKYRCAVVSGRRRYLAGVGIWQAPLGIVR